MKLSAPYILALGVGVLTYFWVLYSIDRSLDGRRGVTFRYVAAVMAMIVFVMSTARV